MNQFLCARKCTLCYAHMHKVFGVQLYKYKTRALLLRILSIVKSDWLQHVRSESGVYEYPFIDNNAWQICFI